MDDVYDVVVVGAGALGLACAYASRKAGLTVALVTAGWPGQASSGQAAAQWKFIHGSAAWVSMMRKSRELLDRFEDEERLDCGLVRSGSVMCSMGPAGADTLRAEVQAAASAGTAAEEISEDRLRRLAPGWGEQAPQIAFWIAEDMYVDMPQTLLDAYLSACRRSGVTIMTRRQVLAAAPAGGGWELSTTGGTLCGTNVINAAGAAARVVGAMAGLPLPIVPVRHQALELGMRPDETARCIVRCIDEGFYARPVGSRTMLVGGFEDAPLVGQGDIGDSAAGLVMPPTDAVVAAEASAGVQQAFPKAEEASLRGCWGGWFAMTPDGQWIVGSHAEAPGWWTAAGCNGSGICLSLAVGDVLSKALTGHGMGAEIAEWSPDRFKTLDPAGTEWIAASLRRYSGYYAEQLDVGTGGDGPPRAASYPQP